MKFELNRGLEPLLSIKKFRFATWDVEAADWWNLKLIGMFDGDAYYHFRNVPNFLDFILQHKYRDWRFFAHFGGRYDLNFIFDYVRTREDVAVSFYCSGSMVVQMTLRRKDSTVKLCDSFRLFQASLRDIGRAFNVEHQKTGIDFGNIEYGKELIEYNEQDCRCLYEVIERFYEETGVYSETFATHALRVFRKDFLKETIWKPREEITEFCRKGYHGGRVEVFKRESSRLKAFDVNSMYPYVMQFGLPVRFVGESRKLSDKFYGFVRAKVEIPEHYVPVLPVRLEKLFFPCGKIEAIWTVEELIAAEAAGAKIQKIEKAYYFETSPVFRDYVLKLYALKKNAGEPTRTIAKLLMNSLYGKFGQNPTKKVFSLERNAPHGAMPILNPDGTPSGFCFHERTSSAAYLLPHLAAAVTSKARLTLLGRLDDRVYYCDTDSVFTDSDIPIGKELGEWGFVGEGSATFIQPKLYKFNGTWKAKGLNRDQSIDDFVAGNANTYKRSMSIKEALRSGQAACQHVDIVKILRETRPKRAWLGNDTRPWNVGELL